MGVLINCCRKSKKSMRSFFCFLLQRTILQVMLMVNSIGDKKRTKYGSRKSMVSPKKRIVRRSVNICTSVLSLGCQLHAIVCLLYADEIITRKRYQHSGRKVLYRHDGFRAHMTKLAQETLIIALNRSYPTLFHLITIRFKERLPVFHS